MQFSGTLLVPRKAWPPHINPGESVTISIILIMVCIPVFRSDKRSPDGTDSCSRYGFRLRKGSARQGIHQNIIPCQRLAFCQLRCIGTDNQRRPFRTFLISSVPGKPSVSYDRNYPACLKKSALPGLPCGEKDRIPSGKGKLRGNYRILCFYRFLFHLYQNLISCEQPSRHRDGSAAGAHCGYQGKGKARCPLVSSRKAALIFLLHYNFSHRCSANGKHFQSSSASSAGPAAGSG